MSSKSSKELSNQIFLISILGFLISIFISFPLWFPSSNTFSPTPFFDSLHVIPEPLHSLVSTFFIFFLVLGFLLKNHRKKLLLFFMISFIVSLIFDQLRWQPWAYYYFFIFLSFLFIPSIKKQDQVNTIRIILALIYLWSGIQKINYSFFFTTYPWLIEPLTELLSENLVSAFNTTHLIAPSLEISAALGLCFRNTSRISAFILILMHIFILGMIGPFGHNLNIVVWPWNITFSVLLYLLFLKGKPFSVLSCLKKRVDSYLVIIILLFGLMPALSFISAWPMFFSSALYSGNKVTSKLFFPEQFKEELPQFIRENIEETDNSIRLVFFTLEELEVPIYPSKAFHLNAFKTLCNKYPEYSIELILLTYSKPDLITGSKSEETFFCDELK